MKYIIKNIDARLGLKEMPEASIDCIVSDPPYRVISGGHGGVESSSDAKRPVGMLSKNDGKIFEDNDLEIEEWIDECYRVLKQDTHIYVMTNFFNLSHYMQAMEKAGFVLHNLLIWEKNNATPNRWYMKNCEYIIFARKGQAKPINFCGSKTVMKIENVKNKIHPTEKPVELLKILIENSTKEGEKILDPFGGSFSTVIASLSCNREVISFEKDEKYFRAGKERVERFVANPTIETREKKVSRITQNQQAIIGVLKEYPATYFTAEQIAEHTGLPTSVCSGCFAPLYSAGLIEKEGKPIKIKLR